MVALGRGLVAQRTVRALVVVEPEVPGAPRVQRVTIGLFAYVNVLVFHAVPEPREEHKKDGS